MEIAVAKNWTNFFPGAHVGVLLVSGVDNTKRSISELDQKKIQVVEQVRARFADVPRKELLKIDVLKAYREYYKGFDKTYHVQLQLESVAHKGKALPNVTPLVDSNFAAEMETFILTSGHDADSLVGAVEIDATLGGEEFTQMNGAKKSLKPNDMMMRDSEGVVCTVIYGQDNRTPITPKTNRALYVSYAPKGISSSQVQQHLDTIKENVRLFCPDAEIKLDKVFSA